MLEPILKKSSDLSCAFIVQKGVKVFIHKFFDKTYAFDKTDIVVFLLVFKGCYKYCWSQGFYYEAFFNDCNLD